MKAGRKSRRNKGPGFLDLLDMRFLSTTRYIDGLWIGTTHDDSETVLRRVEEALHLIKTHDPRRYRRLLCDLERIWVRFDRGVNGCFRAELRGCELSEDFVLADTSSTEEIAAAIVHEATHARLWSCGIEYEEPLRQRIEAACVRRELDFAARLPNGAAQRERAQHMLGWMRDTPLYWTNAAFAERHFDYEVQALRRLGTPEWVVRATLGLRALRIRIIGFFRTIAQRRRTAGSPN